jgi:hypothetical protein
MDEFLAMLNRIRPISEGLTAHLHMIFKDKTVAKDERIVKEGRINDQFFFVSHGLFSCYYTYRGHDITKWIFRQGDIIASTWSYRTQKPGKENMIALKSSSIVYTSFKKLEETYHLFPELEHHARLLTQKYSSLWYGVLDGIRMKTAKERVLYLLDEHPELVKEVTVQHLASLIDLHKTTFTKIRASLKR